jgi:hypothetical protein
LSGFNIIGNLSVSGALSSNSVMYASGGNSNQWNLAHTITQTNSANWNNTFATMTALSTDWENSYTIVAANSANWQSTYTTFQGNSGFGARVNVSNAFQVSQAIYGTLTASSLQLSASNYLVRSQGTNFSISDNVTTLSGSNVLSIGLSAGYNNYGSNNIFVGLCAGFTNLSGHGNILIGRNSNTLTNGLSNAIAFGNFATVSASNQISIGSESFALSTTATAGAIAQYLVIGVNGSLRKIPLHFL